MMRIGLYGGSFDPVHLGHLLVAQAALEELPLDRLHFLPAACSPFKAEAPRAEAAVRLRMLRLALAGWTRCSVDDREVRRGGVSYTVDTLREFAREYPEADFYYLVGADHALLLPQWREAAELARSATFVVVPRPGCPVQLPPPPFRGRILQGVPLAISSSQIRERVRRGLSLSVLTPPAVAEVIDKKRLYF